MRIAPLCVVVLLTGCMTYSYLDPSGSGKTRTVANPCPYPYRVMEVRVQGTSGVRVTINAFRKGDYGFESTTLFIAISDSRVLGFQVSRNLVPVGRRLHHIAFPDGLSTTVTLPGGRTEPGSFDALLDGHLLRYQIPGNPAEVFTVTVPPMEIDGVRVSIGPVSFKPGSATFYGINC